MRVLLRRVLQGCAVGAAAYGGYATYRWQQFYSGALDHPYNSNNDDPSMRDILKCWYTHGDTITEPHHVRPSIDSSSPTQHYDVCVIGGGVAGLQTALSLAERGKKVCVLEARRIASGASGRNGGQLLAAFECDTDEIAESVSDDVAAEMYRQSVADGTERTRQLIQKYGIQCDYDTAKVLAVSFPKSCATAGLSISEAVQNLQAEVNTWRERWGEAWTAVDAAGLADAGLRSPRFAFGKVSVEGASVNPMALMFGLARAVEANGGRVAEYSPVASVQRKDDDDSSMFTVTTQGGGVVTSNHVVLATGSAPWSLAPHLAACTTPVTTAIVVTKPLPKNKLEAVLKPGAIVYDERFHMNYFRVVGGNRILFGGLGSGVPFTDEHIVSELEREFKLSFPSLKDDFAVDTVWQGPTHMRLPSSPMIGHDARTGMWYSLAFGGHGLAGAAAAAERIARAICDGDESYKNWQLFNYVPPGTLPTPSLPLFGTWVGSLGADLTCVKLAVEDWLAGRCD